jgi:hypothetical protein
MKTVKEAHPLWHKLAYAVIYNILKNVSYVAQACKCKVIKTEHIKAVSVIQSNILEQGIYYIPKKACYGMKGGMHGSTVLPSEYFGVDSGRYVDIQALSPATVQISADTALARAPLPATFPSPLLQAGGGLPLPKFAEIKDLIEVCMKTHDNIRISVAAQKLIYQSVLENLKDVFAQLPAAVKSDRLIQAWLKTHPEFAHLRFTASMKKDLQ